jgi:hypothetical protein
VPIQPTESPVSQFFLIYAVRSEGAFHQWRERCINHGEFRPVAIGKIGRLANPRDIRQRHDKAGV